VARPLRHNKRALLPNAIAAGRELVVTAAFLAAASTKSSYTGKDPPPSPLSLSPSLPLSLSLSREVVDACGVGFPAVYAVG